MDPAERTLRRLGGDMKLLERFADCVDDAEKRYGEFITEAQLWPIVHEAIPEITAEQFQGVWSDFAEWDEKNG